MNIVFDLGGVVLDWKPRPLIEKIFPMDSDREKMVTQVLGHQDWVKLDRGTLDLKTATIRAARRTGISEELIRNFFNIIPKILVPIPDTLNLIREIKEVGHRLFILSNMQYESANYIEKNLDFWNLFEPPIFSCRINMVKPEMSIFQHLLDYHQLEASETVFIDDMQVNVESAQELGIHSIRFENAQQCRQQLKDLGCL